MKVLIHICCAHCLAKTLAGLRGLYGADLEAGGVWYNPNIHPLIEYRRRLKAVKVYGERDPVPVIYDEAYGLKGFCRALDGVYDTPERCRICYDLRMERTAQEAAARGWECITSTMVTSRHQDHGLVRAAGERAAAKHGVTFIYHDLREAEAPEKSVQGLYRQSYCGCVFSEEDRYAQTTKHVYAGDRPAPERTE